MKDWVLSSTWNLLPLINKLLFYVVFPKFYLSKIVCWERPESRKEIEIDFHKTFRLCHWHAFVEENSAIVFYVQKCYISKLLLCLVVAIYISLKCHNQTNTFGIGPSIVITRTQNKKNNREMETSSGIGTGYYGTADGISCATSNCSLNDLKSEKMWLNTDNEVNWGGFWLKVTRLKGVVARFTHGNFLTKSNAWTIWKALSLM